MAMAAMSKSETPASGYLFSEDERQGFDTSLRAIQPFLVNVASTYRLRLLPAGPKGWPGRTLTRRVRLRSYALRILLWPSYIDTRQMLWDIDEVWMLDYGELYRRTLSSRSLYKRAGDTELRNGAVQNVIEAALRDVFSAIR
jgi:hypothetical protein